MYRQVLRLFFQWVFPFLCLIFFLQIAIGSSIFYINSLNKTRSYLQQETQRVKEDIKYDNGKWDTSQYNADNDVPGVNPLYIITTDGFVIDRWKTIHGFLDVSEFSRILAYTTPQTINTITNENWRVLAKPISNGREIIGVSLVTEYKPDSNNLLTIDQQLMQTIEDIYKDISVQGTVINTSKLDSRKLPYNITYQIVNKFNKILVQSDNTNSITRTPTFIDTSYVDNQLQAGSEEQVIDTITHKRYLLHTTPFYDKNHEVVGIIVAGAPLDSLYTALIEHLVSFSGASIFLLVIFSPVMIFLISQVIKKGIAKGSIKTEIKQISFLKKESKLIIDTFVIDIAYASYQYYFCNALFSKPQKRWETDELNEQFGEKFEKGSWRKPYDTMVVLNKKVAAVLYKKLFIVKNKTYRINPTLVSKISFQ